MKMREISGVVDKKLQDNNYSEYQLERLHLLGEKNPRSGLKVKVKGFAFSGKLPVPDATTKTTNLEPMKPFMVNQLTIAFERGRMMFSPYDDILYRQLINYSVTRVSSSGIPIFVDVDEHFIDALGLAYLAFVLEFPDVAMTVKLIDHSTRIIYKNVNFGPEKAAQIDLGYMATGTGVANPWANQVDHSEMRGERANYFKVPLGKPLTHGGCFGWGSRKSSGGSRNNGRSMW